VYKYEKQERKELFSNLFMSPVKGSNSQKDDHSDKFVLLPAAQIFVPQSVPKNRRSDTVTADECGTVEREILFIIIQR